MENYIEDLKKYTEDVKEDAVEALVGHLGLALKSRDSAAVAATDPAELDAVKTGYCRKTLDMTPEEADVAVSKAAEIMKGVNTKSRVTFYYLVAEAGDKLGRLAG